MLPRSLVLPWFGNGCSHIGNRIGLSAFLTLSRWLPMCFPNVLDQFVSSAQLISVTQCARSCSVFNLLISCVESVLWYWVIANWCSYSFFCIPCQHSTIFLCPSNLVQSPRDQLQFLCCSQCPAHDVLLQIVWPAFAQVIVECSSGVVFKLFVVIKCRMFHVSLCQGLASCYSHELNWTVTPLLSNLCLPNLDWYPSLSPSSDTYTYTLALKWQHSCHSLWRI